MKMEEGVQHVLEASGAEDAPASTPSQDDWVLVPREPTEALWKAIAGAFCAFDGCDMSTCPDDGKTCRGGLSEGDKLRAKAVYRAMLSAAPQPKPIGKLNTATDEITTPD